MVGSPPLLALAFCAAIIFGQLLEVAQSQSQNKTQPRTIGAEPGIFVWGGQVATLIYLSRQPHIHIYISFFYYIHTFLFDKLYIYTHQTTTKRA